MSIINVLDHGFVRLVSYMQPVPIPAVSIDMKQGMYGHSCEWTGDLEIVRNARVSHDADWRGPPPDYENEDVEKKDAKLIDYMMKNGHTSPFESMVFTFEIKCPMFIARQWHRHRTWSYNEVSARYTELPNEFYVPRPEDIGTQSKSNKQGRDLGVTTGVAENMAWIIENECKGAFDTYHRLLEFGVPREIARSVLPLATYTRFFGTVDLHNLFHFLALRLHEHAQYEMRLYGAGCLDLIRPLVPVAVEAFERYKLHTGGLEAVPPGGPDLRKPV